MYITKIATENRTASPSAGIGRQSCLSSNVLGRRKLIAAARAIQLHSHNEGIAPCRQLNIALSQSVARAKLSARNSTQPTTASKKVVVTRMTIGRRTHGFSNT